MVSFGGREVRHGGQVRSRSPAHPVKLTTPEGGVLEQGAGVSGDLIAVWRASNIDSQHLQSQLRVCVLVQCGIGLRTRTHSPRG
jgi:hypothetical protein